MVTKFRKNRHLFGHNLKQTEDDGDNKDFLGFSSRVRTLTGDIDIAILSACPSVWLSVRHVPVIYRKGVTLWS